MIFFGLSKQKQNVTQHLGPSTCPNCKEEGYLHAFAYPRYFHLYWIPMFSIGKRSGAICDNCGTTFKGKKLPKSAMIYTDDLKKEVKIPIWHFSGIAVLVGLIALIVGVGLSDDKQQTEYIEEPKVNDVYSLKTNDGFTRWKLIGIEEDSLIIHTLGICIYQE